MNTEQTKKCRECQSDIPKKARRCPNCRAKQGIGAGGALVAIIFVGIVASIVMSPSENSTPKQPANMSAIQAGLDEYAEGRWLDTQLANNDDGILIRITVDTEVAINDVAATSYCNVIGDNLRQNAPDHVRDADVFIYQFGEEVKVCTY